MNISNINNIDNVELPVIGQELELGEVILLCESLSLFDLRNKILDTSTHIQILNPFVTDGASCCPENLNDKVFLAAVIHDLRYWFGGTQDDRLLADYEFGINIIKLCNLSAIESQAMFEAVRLGGQGWMPTPWRWGFGWE